MGIRPDGAAAGKPRRLYLTFPLPLALSPWEEGYEGKTRLLWRVDGGNSTSSTHIAYNRSSVLWVEWKPV
ncbi:hypothetical protein GCM10022293_46510 [Azospirillum formosense]